MTLPLECGLTVTKEVLGGKWKISLIYAISEGILRPSDLQRVIPGSTKWVLNKQLTIFLRRRYTASFLRKRSILSPGLVKPCYLLSK